VISHHAHSLLLRFRRIAYGLFAAGTISTYAGKGTILNTQYVGPATSISLNSPSGMAIDSTTGNLYFADSGNYVIRMVARSTGVITTVAGSGRFDNGGDGGLATAASLESPTGVAVDSTTGNIYIADDYDNTIRMITNSTGIIAAVAGNGDGGYSGDGGVAVKAALNKPFSIVVDQSNGNLYIADTFNHVIRMVTKSTGIITTIAGTGTQGGSGDGGLAKSASLSYPHGVAVEAATGNVYIADTFNHVIRMITKSTGVISTVAGTIFTNGYKGDGGLATSALLQLPYGVTADSLSGNLIIVDTNNNLIRIVLKSTGIITTIAGDALRDFSGDGGPAIYASLDRPRSAAYDSSSGTMYIADTRNSAVRVVAGSLSTAASSSPSMAPIGTGIVTLD
jgi:trimeric autotransporter adhesin